MSKAKKRSRRSSRSAKWLTVGTMAVSTAFCSGIVYPALAQTTPTARESGSSDPLPALTVRRYDIAAGTLGDALRTISQVAEVTISAPNPSMLAISSRQISGNYTLPEVMKLLLAGTGIDYRFTSKSSIVLTFSTVSEVVEVSASALAVPSVKYTESLLETPQSISVVSNHTLAQQGVSNLRDALRNVAGISLAAGEGGAQGDNLTIRGFAARNDIFLDGIRDFGSYFRDPFNTESVAVLEGPASIMFGRGSTGGVVNQTTKAPASGTFASGSLTFGLDRTRRATIDLNHEMPSFAHGSSLRLNAMGDEGTLAGRDIGKERRFGVAPSLTLGLDSRTRATFSYFHQSEYNTPDYGIPWLFNGPAPVDRRNHYGFAEGNFLDTTVNAGTVKIEHNANESVTVQNQLRYASYQRDVRVTQARILGTVTPATPLEDIMVSRNQIAAQSDETLLWDQFDVLMRLRTGGLRHSLVVGAEGGKETSDPTRLAFTGVPTTSLLHPNTTDQFAGVSNVTSQVNAEAKSAAAYAYDTVSIGSRLQLSGGIRFDYFSADFQQFVAPGATFHRVDRMPNWRAAVMYRPADRGNVYFSYGTSVNPSAEALSLSASTANTDPEKSRTFEFGSKWDFRRFNVRGALFRTEKTNAREPDPNNPLLNILTGVQRVDGIELSFSGRITDRWSLLSSYALMDSRLVSSRAFPLAIGSRLANVPRNTFNLWTTYQLPKQLQIGLGGNFVDKRTASSTAPLDPVTGLVKQLPGYWVFNAMAQYPFSERVALQVNVYNLADRYYFDAAHPNHIIPGAARTARLSLNYKLTRARKP